MRIFLLNRTDREPSRGEFEGNVVIASSPEKARELCARNCANEGELTWMSPVYSSCEEVGVSNETTARILLRSYKE